MKNQTLHLCAVLLFLLTVSSESIRVLSTKQGEEINHKKITNGDIRAETSMNELMGLEACEEGDDECIERRMVSEAHLDYIYTQKNRP